VYIAVPHVIFPNAAQQFNYERSSQARISTCLPNLLSAAGYLDNHRMAFHVV
jgi:hypothetical protein